MIKRISAFGLISLLLLSTACSQNQTRNEPNYYLLPSSSEAVSENKTQFAIGIPTVLVADYINNDGIALQTRNNQIRIANYHLWAEQPDQAITRVLQSELSHMLPTIRIDNGFAGSSDDWRYKLILQVDQFHGSESGYSVLSGFWRLQDRDGEKVFHSARFSYQVPLKEPGYDALVDALRQQLSQLAKSLAVQIRSIAGTS